MARSRKVDVRPAKRGRPVTLSELVAREHKRIANLERELAGAKRRLARARIRYSTLLRLASDQLRREAGEL